MASQSGDLILVSLDLDKSGLVWHPEIGDEVTERSDLAKVSILVDPQGLTPRQLRENFVWLPTVEQFVHQFEARQALVYHAGVTTSLAYEAVIRTSGGVIEATAASLRLAFGRALQKLLTNMVSEPMH